MSRPALCVALFVASSAALVACDGGGAEPIRDTGPPLACQLAGCPADEICLDSGDCVTPSALADAAEACVALDECLAPCFDQPCYDACGRLAGNLAVGRYNALVQCVQFNDCFRPSGGVDVPCLRDNCGAEHDACPIALPASPEGGGRCGPFVQCLNACPFDPPEAEQQCLDDCVRATSPAAFDLYLAAIECVTTNCADGAPGCQEEQCGAQVDACFDQGLGTGTLPCSDVIDCVFSCPDNECYERCEVDASPEGFVLWRAFVDCAAPIGCGSYDACLVACPDETRACENDRR
ncbi:MAG: hypothetical protein H6705_12820 [Myxococcales bacterium]|nr:hypothetical protein [Myxococcales bacterium]